MDELRERMRTFEVPARDLTDVVRRARSIRRRRAIAGGLVAAVAVAGIATPLILLSPVQMLNPSASSPSPRVVRDDGVSLQVPPDWTVDLGPASESPGAALLLAGSWPGQPSACQESPPEDGVLLWLSEIGAYGGDVDPHSFPPRRDSFEDSRPYGSFAEIACAAGQSIRGEKYRFRDGGRFFEVTVAYPDHASESTRRLGVEVLDTLRVEPTGERVCPEGGPWSDPDCPASRWVQLVVHEAGGVIRDDTGSAFVVRAGGTTDTFYLWAFPEDSSSPEPAFEVIGEVDGHHVYASDIRGFWQAQGLQVFFEAGPDGDPLPRMDILERFVRASIAIEYPPPIFDDE